jgi:hypothetical protein
MVKESAKPKSLPNLDGLSEEQRRIVAEGIATMHRFAAEPSFKYGKPQYHGRTVEAAAHAKSKRGR